MQCYVEDSMAAYSDSRAAYSDSMAAYSDSMGLFKTLGEHRAVLRRGLAYVRIDEKIVGAVMAAAH